MIKIGAFNAKTHLSKLLRQVAAGEEFLITKGGVPVAKLVPVSDPQPEAVEKAIEDILKFRKGRKATQKSIQKMIKEGRRF